MEEGSDFKPRIVLRKARDFGQRLNAAFAFMRQERRLFVQAGLLIVLPWAVVSSALAGYWGYSSITDRLAFTPSVLAYALVLSAFHAFFAYAGLSALASGLVAARLDRPAEDIPFAEAWKKQVWPRLGAHLALHGLGYVLAVMASFASAALIVFFTVAVVGSFIDLVSYDRSLVAEEILGYLLLIAMAFCLMLSFLPVLVGGTAVNVERLGPFEAFKRGVSLVRKRFGAAFWSAAIGYGVAFVAQIVLVLPAGFLFALLYSDMQASGFAEPMTAALAFAAFAAFLSFALTLPWLPVYLAGAMNYLSTVEETEQAGLLEQVDRLGEPEGEGGG